MFFYPCRWDREMFMHNERSQDDYRDSRMHDSILKPNNKVRDTFKDRAKEIQEGTRVWRPTWQALGLNYDRSSVAKRFGGNDSESKSESNSPGSG